jgi:hypothetical protein
VPGQRFDGGKTATIRRAFTDLAARNFTLA